jgi:alcohol dehydrogenase class IV
MLSAASMGATAFQKGLGAIHSLAHPVGAVYNTHHGLANAVFMPYVIDFNRDAISRRMMRLGRYLGLADASFDGVMQWTLDFRKLLEIPHTAREIGVEESRLDELAKMAAVDPTASGNPVKVGAAEMKQMYEAAMEGRIG